MVVIELNKGRVLCNESLFACSRDLFGVSAWQHADPIINYYLSLRDGLFDALNLIIEIYFLYYSWISIIKTYHIIYSYRSFFFDANFSMVFYISLSLFLIWSVWLWYYFLYEFTMNAMIYSFNSSSCKHMQFRRGPLKYGSKE